MRRCLEYCCRLALFGTLAVSLAGCAAFEPDPTRVGEYQLTQEERDALIQIARFNLTRDGTYATPQEQHIIKSREPEFDIAYSAPRTGRATIRWELGQGKAIRATALGRFLTSRMTWRVNIENFGAVEYNRTAPVGRPLGREDFADLLTPMPTK